MERRQHKLATQTYRSDDKQMSFNKTQTRLFNAHVTERSSDLTRNKCNKHFVRNDNLAFPSSECVEMRIESWDRVTFHKIAHSAQRYLILESKIVYINPPTKAVFSNVSFPYQSNVTSAMVCSAFMSVLIKKGVTEQGIETTRLMPEQMLSMLSNDWINILPYEVRIKFINMSKSIHPEDSFAQFKLLDDITATTYKTREGLKEDSIALFKLLDEITTKTKEKPEEDSLADFTLLANITTDKTGEKPTEIDILLDGMNKEFINKLRSVHPEISLTQLKLLYQITTLLTKTGEAPIELQNASAGERSKHESTSIKLYKNVIRNETCRMMTSIDMVVSEAERLFGHERTQIFFDLLDDELFHFESARAAPEFIPNMTESTVRQHVISFFELSCDVMNRLMTLFKSYPDSKRLQQMSEQNFISLMQSVIDSSLKTKTKGGKELSLKESIFIMVDFKEFETPLREEIPGEVSERLGCGDEATTHKIVDSRLGRTQASERRDVRPIYYIYFPSDCRLFIYIPTENGSYWHQTDMKRASRIR